MPLPAPLRAPATPSDALLAHAIESNDAEFLITTTPAPDLAQAFVVGRGEDAGQERAKAKIVERVRLGRKGGVLNVNDDADTVGHVMRPRGKEHLAIVEHPFDEACLPPAPPAGIGPVSARPGIPPIPTPGTRPPARVHRNRSHGAAPRSARCASRRGGACFSR